MHAKSGYEIHRVPSRPTIYHASIHPSDRYKSVHYIFHHGVLNSLGSHLYSARTNTTNKSLSARRNLGTSYASYLWDNGVSINTLNSDTGNYMKFTRIGGARAIFRNGAHILSLTRTEKNTISQTIMDFIGYKVLELLNLGIT